MKTLVLISLIASSAFASNSPKTKALKNTNVLSLQEIAEKSQNTSTLFDQEKKPTINLTIDNSGRLNNKEEALKISAENNKKTATKK